MYSKAMLSLLPYMAAMGGMTLPVRQGISEGHYMRQSIKEVTDKVMEALVNKGSCFVSDNVFFALRDTLQNKLKGEVLFHSDIKTKKVFITYTRSSY